MSMNVVRAFYFMFDLQGNIIPYEGYLTSVLKKYLYLILNILKELFRPSASTGTAAAANWRSRRVNVSAHCSYFSRDVEFLFESSNPPSHGRCLEVGTKSHTTATGCRLDL